MSISLWALIIMQGTNGLAFEPGYISKEACQAVYRGPSVICFEYDPNLTTWTAFFKTPTNGFGAIWRFPTESACQGYVAALRPDAAGACRQLAHVENCPVACTAPVPPPVAPCQPCGPSVTPPPKPPAPQPQSVPEKKPDPVLIMDRNGHEPSFSNRPIMTASASTTPAAAPLHQNPKRVVRRGQQQFDPIGALVALFTLKNY
jgi:hypothetical protein